METLLDWCRRELANAGLIGSLACLFAGGSLWFAWKHFRVAQNSASLNAWNERRYCGPVLVVQNTGAGVARDIEISVGGYHLQPDVVSKLNAIKEMNGHAQCVIEIGASSGGDYAPTIQITWRDDLGRHAFHNQLS